MTTELTVKQKQEMWLQQNGLTAATWSSLQNSIYPGANPESILMAVNYCRARGLDPLKKPVHIVPLYVADARTGQKGMRDVIMPGIYELRTTAARTGQYIGMDDAIYGPMIDFKGISAPEFCKVTVHRMVGAQKASFSHTEYFVEAVATKKEGGPNAMWSKRPRGQLAKCAEAGALRKAFPDELGGIHSSEEAQEYELPEKQVGGSALSDIEAEILGEEHGGEVTALIDRIDDVVYADEVDLVNIVEPKENIPTKYISKDQVDRLIGLIIDSESDESKFCLALKVARIEEIPLEIFGRAEAMLIKKLTAKKEQ